MDSIRITELTEESRQEILHHLATVLVDRRFASAERNAGFLRCVVEKALAGRMDEIKETVIAMEVYGRSAGYDPKSDSIVRVEASRLRQKLRSYYENEGRDSPIRMCLPSGSYIPRFERVGQTCAATVGNEASCPAPIALPVRRRIVAATIAAGLALLPVLLLLPLARGSYLTATAAPETLEAWREGVALLDQDPHLAQTEWGPPRTLRRAVERLEFAVARSPRFAPAWASLAEAYDYAEGFVLPDAAQAFSRAEKAARTAIRLDDSLAAGHHMLALQLKNVLWDFQSAEVAYRRALSLDARNAYAVVELADLLWQTGRLADAAALVARARAAIPGRAVLAAKDSEIQLALGRPDAALAAAAAALELQRDYWRAYVTMGMAHESMGDFASARACYRRVLDIDPHERRALPAYGALLARVGETSAAREVASLLEQRNTAVRNCAFQVAVVYAALGEHERALGWLERSWRTRQAHFPFAAAEPRFRDLRGDPRFRELLGRVGLKPVEP